MRVTAQSGGMGRYWWTLGVWVSWVVLCGGGGGGGVQADSPPGMTDDQVCNQNTASYSAGKPPQIDTYTLKINQTKYVPGQPVQVTISGPAFKGFILQARKYGTVSNVGTFKASPDEAQVKRCVRGNDTISGWFTTLKQNVTYTWIAPEDDLGPVHFVGTIFQDEKTYWTNITSHSFRKGFAPIDLSQCGKTKGCYRYTNGGETCTPDTCVYLVTYQVNGPQATFEISALADWAAIGFSSDNQMGGDDVFMCIRTRNAGKGADVHHYFNEYAHQTPSKKDRNPLVNPEVEVLDVGGERRVSCRFQRALKIHNDQYSVDLYNDWFQLYAWGTVTSSDTLMRHDIESPPTSATKLTLFRKIDEISAASNISRGVYYVSILLTLYFGNIICHT